MSKGPRADVKPNEKERQRNIQREIRANVKKSENFSKYVELRLGVSKQGRLPTIENNPTKLLDSGAKGPKALALKAASVAAVSEVLRDAFRALTVNDRFGPSAQLKAEIVSRLLPGEVVLVETSALNADGSFDWISIGSPNRDRLRPGSSSPPTDVLQKALVDAAGSRQHLENAPTVFTLERPSVPVNRCSGENIHGESTSRRSESGYRDLEREMMERHGRRAPSFDAMCELPFANP